MVEALRILREIQTGYPAVFRAFELDKVAEDLRSMPMSATEEMIWQVLRGLTTEPESNEP
jgi:hypothetical protein